MTSGTFPSVDFTLNVLVLALIPSIVGYAGNAVASEGITDPVRRKKIKAWFCSLFVAGFATTVWQQYRVVLTEQGKPNASVTAIREAFPWLSKEPQSQTPPSPNRPQPARSTSNPYINVLNVRLNEMLKTDTDQILGYQNEWARRDHLTMVSFGEIRARGPVPNSAELRPLTPAEWAPYKKQQDETYAKTKSDMIGKSKDVILQWADLRNEILTNRFHATQTSQLPSSSNVDSLIAKVRAGEYSEKDLTGGYTYITAMAKAFDGYVSGQ